MVEITLQPHEIATAAWVGVRRHIASKQRGLRDKHGFTGDGYGIHVEGAGGEMAAAKALNMYWDGSVNVFKRPDLTGIQVRTRSSHDYELIVRHDDNPDDTFVLVTGQMPNYRVHGWVRGRDAMQKALLKTHGNRPAAYFVPQFMLHPIDHMLAMAG